MLSARVQPDTAAPRPRSAPARYFAGWAALIAVSLAGAAAAVHADVARVRVNGVPLAVVERDVAGAPAQVAGEVLRRWRDAADADWVWRGTLGDQLLLARQRGPLHESWLVGRGRTGAGSRIVVSVRDFARAVQPLARPPLAWPVGARLLSVVESDDRRTAANVEFLLWSPQRPPTARAGWDAALRTAGWKLATATTPACGERRRARERLLVCLAPQASGTTAVLQWRRP